MGVQGTHLAHVLKMFLVICAHFVCHSSFTTCMYVHRCKHNDNPFFIHSICNICMQHNNAAMTQLRINNRYISHVSIQCAVQVILSPWAISGTLVGAASESNIDRSRCRGGPWSTDRPSMKRLWRAWTRYYPSLSDDTENNIDDDDDEDDVSSYLIGDEKTNKISDQLPNLVEVGLHEHI